MAIGVVSLAFHAAIFAALLYQSPTTPSLIEARAIEVTLAAPPSPAKPPKATNKPPTVPPLSPTTPRAQAQAQTAQPTAAAVAAPPSSAPQTREIVAPPGFTARGTLTGGGEALRQAARKSACTEADIVKLTKAERDACAEALGEKHKNGPALYAAIDPEKKAAFDGDCKKDDEWCLYRTGKGPYPGLFAIGKKKKIPGWD